MPDQLTLAQRVSTSFSQLSTIASDLNAVSDELGRSIAQIDFALKNLNLGITVWIKIRFWEGDEQDDLEFWSEELGYAKINGKWGISLKRIEGNNNYPDRAHEESWLFNEAPRALRLLAIDKIPELLSAMSTQASTATTKIHEKLADVRAVAAVVNPPGPSPVPTIRKVVTEALGSVKK